jgi:hypothetical protein
VANYINGFSIMSERNDQEKDQSIKERELSLKEKEIEAKIKIDRKSLWLASPLLAGIFVAGFQVYSTSKQAQSNFELERQKFEYTLVQQTLAGNTLLDEKEKLFEFMIEIGAIRDAETVKGLENRISKKTLPIPKIRVYLLTGADSRIQMFAAIKSELEKINFIVLGAKKLEDDTRTDEPEIRYFNSSDQAQADRIKEVVKSRFPNRKIETNYQRDSSAAPGYIEVWLGR